LKFGIGIIPLAKLEIVKKKNIFSFIFTTNMSVKCHMTFFFWEECHTNLYKTR